MLLWILMAVSATMVALMMVVPLIQRRTVETPDGLGVFEGQLAELKRDREIGLIEPDAARLAELEIRRRLDAARRAEEGLDGQSPRFRQFALIASLVAVMVAVPVYMQLGSPHLVGLEEPAAPEIPEEMRAVLAEMDALAADLNANPENPQGWALLGQAYMAIGRYGDAVISFDNALVYAPDMPELFVVRGQAQVLEGGGVVTPAARESFARALDLDPENVLARFFIAEARFQAGEEAQAIAEWESILEADMQDGLRSMIEARLNSLSEGEAAN